MIFKENSKLLCSAVCVVFFLFMLHNNLQLVFTALEDNKFCQLDMRKFDVLIFLQIHVFVTATNFTPFISNLSYE